MSKSSTDVLIVGGGLTGSTAAHALANKGVHVTLVDANAVLGHVFKAEKAGPHSLPQLHRLGVGAALEEVSRKLSVSMDAAGGRVLRRMKLGEHGYYYHDLVNRIRRGFPPGVTFVEGNVRGMETGPGLQRVRLANDDVIEARLVILACGGVSHLFEELGLTRSLVIDAAAIGFAMCVEPLDGGKFWFDGASVTYYPDDAIPRLSYCSFFSVPGAMRINMFGFHDIKSPWVAEMKEDPRGKLGKVFPKLTQLTGDFRVNGKVEVMPVRPGVTLGYRKPGFVLAGDAFSSVPPSSGKGVYKLMHDVEVLTRRVPGWLETPGMALDKINEYYDDPQKREATEHTLQKTIYQHWAATSPTTRAQIHRWRFFADAYMKNLVGYTADLG